MSISLRPKVLAGSPKGSVPTGFWTSVEVMNELLLDCWGERAYQRSGRLYSFDVHDGNFIATLEQNSHLRECCGLLRGALIDGHFEALIRKNDQKPERIPPDSWLSVPRKDLRINFILGEAFAGWENDSPLKPLEGGIFIFEIAKVKQWLGQLDSPHLLPMPLQRCPLSISEKPFVTLCEATYWLADGFPRTEAEAQMRSIEDSDFAAQKLDDNRLSELGEWNLELIEIEDFVAWQMAETVRINRVQSILRDKIADGTLEAFGCYVDQGGREYELLKVDPDFFLHSVGLSSLHDQTCVDPNAEHGAYRKAREAGLWKSIRFRRADLVRLFVSQPEVQDEAVTVSTPKHPRMSVAEAKRRYLDRVETWDVNVNPPTREDDEAWFKSDLGVSRDSARKIRRENAPESWQRGGRRKKLGGN